MRTFNNWMYERLYSGARRRVADRHKSAGQSFARRLSFEALEARRLLTVTASASDNVVTIMLGAASDTASIVAAAAGSGGLQTISVSGTGLSATQFSGTSSIQVDYGAANQTVTFNGSTAIVLGGALNVSDTSNSTGESLVFANATTYGFGSVSIWTSQTTSVGTVAVNDSLAALNGTLTIGTGTPSTSPVWSQSSATGTISAASGDLDISVNTTLTDTTAMLDQSGSIRLVSSTGITDNQPITAVGLSATVSTAAGDIILEGSNWINGPIAFSTTAATYSSANGIALNDILPATVGTVAANTTAGSFAAVTGITATDGDVNLSGGGLTINNPILASAGDVRLFQSGAISQTSGGVITATGLSLNDSAGNIILEAANSVGTIATNSTNAGGVLEFNNGSSAVVVGGVVGASATLDPSGLFQLVLAGIATNNGDVGIKSGGLTLTDFVNAGTGNVRFVEAGNITQGTAGAITAGGLSITDTGGSEVLETSNAISNLAVSNTASASTVTLNDGTATLAIAAIAAASNTVDTSGLFGAVSGIATSNADVNLSSGSLAINQPVAAGTGNVRLIISSAATEGAAGTVTASALSISTATSAILEAANVVATLATSMDGTLSFNNGSNSLTAGTVAAASTNADPSGLFKSVSGIYTNHGSQGDINVKSGALSITEGLDAGLSNNIRLVETGTVTQATTIPGDITTGGLSITTTTGNVILENSGNSTIPTLAMNNAGPGGVLEFNVGNANLGIGTIAAASNSVDPAGLFGALSGLNTNNGDIGIKAGALTISSAISAGTANMRWVLYRTATQTASVTAAELSISYVGIGGTTVLESANNIGTLATYSSFFNDPFTFSNGSTPLVIGSIAAASSTVDTGNLFGAVSGITTVNADVNLQSGGLSINQPVNVGTGNVRLAESAAVTPSSITAGGLSVSDSGGSVTVGLANSFSTLAVSESSPGVAFSFSTSNALTIGAIAAAGTTADPSGLFPAVNGIATNGGAISLVSAGTNTALTVNGNVVSGGGNVTLQASGNVTVGTNVTVNGSTAPMTLAADLTAGGVGDDGIGTLTISSGANVVTAGTITLRGADESIDTSSSPAYVGAAARSQATTPSATLTGLNSPEWMAFDKSGNLYVANFGGTTVSVFAPGATTPTSTLTGLHAPTAVAFDSTGNIYVANATGGTISVFNQGTTTPASTLTGLNDPTAMAFDAAGNLYVANHGGSTVSVFAPGSTTPTETLTGLTTPFRLAFDPNGNLFVANTSGTISEFAPGSTTATASLTGLNNPVYLAFDSAGNLYVANNGNGTVSIFAPGSTVATSTLTGLAGAYCLIFDSSGNLYVSSKSTSTISVFAPGQTSPQSTLTGLSDPEHLALDTSGNLYASNHTGNTVSVFSPASVTAAAAGVVIQSSVESQPMLVGGTNNNPVAGINLTSAELAQIFTTSIGTITIGDSQQTGNITFSTATPATTAGAALDVVQSTASAGQIILDEGGSGDRALNGNGGTVMLTAGTGGVQAALFTSGLPLETAGFSAAGPLNLTLEFAPAAGAQLTIVDNTAAAGDAINGTFSNLPQGGTVAASYQGTSYTFQANYAGGDGNDLVLTEVQSTGPAVVGAYVSGTAWSTAYLSTLDAAGLGSSAAADQGFELASGANQLTTMLPWTNITQISLAFGEPVSVSQNSLTLYNSANTAITASGFSYNSAANIATWQFATPLAANKYVMNLAANSVTDSNGQALDGAWTTSVSTFAAGSGNGTPGSDFNFYFDVLPGDVNSSGSVTNGDVLLTKLQVGAVANSTNYLDDVNGASNITNSDVLLEKLQVGSNINAYPAPQLPPQAAPAAVPEISLLDATPPAATPSDGQADTSVVATAPAAEMVVPEFATADASVTADAVDSAAVDSSVNDSSVTTAAQAAAIQPTSAAAVLSVPNSPAASMLIVSAPATVSLPASSVATVMAESAPSTLTTDSSPAALPVALLPSAFKSATSVAPAAATDDALALMLESLGLAASPAVFTPAGDVADNAAPTSLPPALAAGLILPPSMLVWDEVFSTHSEAPAEGFTTQDFDLAAASTALTASPAAAKWL